jgi:hypothetical protein
MVPTIAIPNNGIRAFMPKGIRAFMPSILIRNALYWELDDGTILELDLQSYCLELIQKPRDVNMPEYHYHIVKTTGNRLGFAITPWASMGMELWERRSNCHGVAEWVLEKTVELDKVLPHGASSLVILDFIEDNNTILLATRTDLFTIQLESMECRHVGKRKYNMYRSYTSFYTGLDRKVV